MAGEELDEDSIKGDALIAPTQAQRHDPQRTSIRADTETPNPKPNPNPITLILTFTLSLAPTQRPLSESCHRYPRIVG